VLASLAIPRFTEASAKAKMAEAPRVLASYESAFLAAIAEQGEEAVDSEDDLIFKPPKHGVDSKWFEYELEASTKGTAPSDVGACKATAQSKIGKFENGKYLKTEYDPTLNSNDGGFEHTSDDDPNAKILVPNFYKS